MTKDNDNDVCDGCYNSYNGDDVSVTSHKAGISTAMTMTSLDWYCHSYYDDFPRLALPLAMTMTSLCWYYHSYDDDVTRLVLLLL